ncbi:MAG TPA: response regulator [Micropepsaceae bacterium]|nr:response regulator [Micropepsaceae bacterium]HRK71440.1 response regulator [Micropepsaceae bacterium]
MSATVLIVEDNALVLEVYRSCLSPLGLGLLVARSGEEALRLLATETPQLAVLDIYLPGVSGYQVLAAMRAHTRLKHIPAIAVTNAATPEERQKLAHAGFQAVLPKPVAVAEFVSTVRRILQR